MQLARLIFFNVNQGPIECDEWACRERRLKNLRTAVGIGLDEEVKRNKSTLTNSLIVDFNKEMTLAETCVYHDDFDGALYHGFVASMIHRTLNELDQSMNETSRSS